MNSMEGNIYSENPRTTGYLAKGQPYSEFKHDSVETRRFENCQSKPVVKKSKMRLNRRIQLTLISLFSIITFHKYYICEACYKIHKRNDNEFPICGGWYRGHIFVSRDCASKTITNARKALYDGLIERYK